MAVGPRCCRSPRQLHRIVSAVRRAVPAGLPVSAKMRLGFDDDQAAEDCARAIAAGGADQLVVHGRTRAQGYAAGLLGPHCRRARRGRYPVVANGEIWTVADAQRCRAESGCHDLMLGRGMVADPGLAWDILAADGLAETGRGPCWADLQPLFQLFWGGRAARGAAQPGRAPQAVAQLPAPPLSRGRAGLPEAASDQ
jgi:tRNA-dihydrouridine synthase C